MEIELDNRAKDPHFLPHSMIFNVRHWTRNPPPLGNLPPHPPHQTTSRRLGDLVLRPSRIRDDPKKFPWVIRNEKRVRNLPCRELRKEVIRITQPLETPPKWPCKANCLEESCDGFLCHGFTCRAAPLHEHVTIPCKEAEPELDRSDSLETVEPYSELYDEFGVEFGPLWGAVLASIDAFCPVQEREFFELIDEAFDKARMTVWYPECLDWSVDEVCKFIKSLGFPHYYENCFRKNQINGNRLYLCNSNRLPEMNIKYWKDIRFITREIRKLLKITYQEEEVPLRVSRYSVQPLYEFWLRKRAFISLGNEERAKTYDFRAFLNEYEVPCPEEDDTRIFAKATENWMRTLLERERARRLIRIKVLKSRSLPFWVENKNETFLETRPTPAVDINASRAEDIEDWFQENKDFSRLEIQHAQRKKQRDQDRLFREQLRDLKKQKVERDVLQRQQEQRLRVLQGHQEPMGGFEGNANQWLLSFDEESEDQSRYVLPPIVEPAQLNISEEEDTVNAGGNVGIDDVTDEGLSVPSQGHLSADLTLSYAIDYELRQSLHISHNRRLSEMSSQERNNYLKGLVEWGGGDIRRTMQLSFNDAPVTHALVQPQVTVELPSNRTPNESTTVMEWTDILIALEKMREEEEEEGVDEEAGGGGGEEEEGDEVMVDEQEEHDGEEEEK